MSNLSDFIGGTPLPWVTGTTYQVGKVVLSTVDFCYYVRKVAGAGSTDPSSDTTNWQNTNGIKSIQRGTIAISGAVSSATATISAVVTAKSELRFLGFTVTSNDLTAGSTHVALTNSTTITATRGSTSGNCTASWELTERY